MVTLLRVSSSPLVAAAVAVVVVAVLVVNRNQVLAAPTSESGPTAASSFALWQLTVSRHRTRRRVWGWGWWARGGKGRGGFGLDLQLLRQISRVDEQTNCPHRVLPGWGGAPLYVTA